MEETSSGNCLILDCPCLGVWRLANDNARLPSCHQATIKWRWRIFIGEEFASRLPKPPCACEVVVRSRYSRNGGRYSGGRPICQEILPSLAYWAYGSGAHRNASRHRLPPACAGFWRLYAKVSQPGRCNRDKRRYCVRAAPIATFEISLFQSLHHYLSDDVSFQQSVKLPTVALVFAIEDIHVLSVSYSMRLLH